MKSLLKNDLVLTIEKNFEWKPSYDTQRSPFSPANKWYLIDHLIRLLCVLCSQKDGTLQTTSSLAFTASVYDNGRTFKCYAENSVTRSENMKPMIESMTIEVLCKWTIIFDVSVPCCRRHRVVTNEHASFSLLTSSRTYKVLLQRILYSTFLHWFSFKEATNLSISNAVYNVVRLIFF